MARASRRPTLLKGALPTVTLNRVREANPHWEGKPGPEAPEFRRYIFPRLYRLLTRGLTPVVALRGPRRIGKTILVRQVMDQLRSDGVPASHILYMPFDALRSLRGIPDLVLELATWYEATILGMTINEAAREERDVYFLLDEVQDLINWAPQVKHLVDNRSVRVLLTGSSSLRIELGQDSLAGRVTTIDLGPLLLREISGLRYGFRGQPRWPSNGVADITRIDFWRDAKLAVRLEQRQRDRAFDSFSARGAYPIAHQDPGQDWQELANYLNETVVRRVIQHDLRLGERGRKRDESLLRAIFLMSCRYAGQAIPFSTFAEELKAVYSANVGKDRVRNYLRFLDSSLLLRLIEPLELRLKRKKAPSKICLSDHTLRASWLGEIVPLSPRQLARQSDPAISTIAGHLAESTLGYYLSEIPNISLAWYPARGSEPEIDFVVSVGDQRIPIEVKYQRKIDRRRDGAGIVRFCENKLNRAPFGLLVTQLDGARSDDERILTISLASLLWLR